MHLSICNSHQYVKPFQTDLDPDDGARQKPRLDPNGVSRPGLKRVAERNARSIMGTDSGSAGSPANMTLLLSEADVEGLLDLPGAMEATRQALREQAADAVTAVPPRHINVPR